MACSYFSSVLKNWMGARQILLYGFLAAEDSSRGDLVTQSLSQTFDLIERDCKTLEDNERQ